MSIECFLKSNFLDANKLFALIYLNQNNGVKAKRCNAKKYYLPKDIIKNHNVSINRKIYCQPIDSDIKGNEEVRKLATEQGEYYTKGYLLDYYYIKNQNQLIGADLGRQNE